MYVYKYLIYLISSMGARPYYHETTAYLEIGIWQVFIYRFHMLVELI